MARARNIKPGFFGNEQLAEVAFEYRLLFIGLWTMADREGRLEDRPKRIKMAVFPADDVDIDRGLRALESAGLLVRYTVNGARYIAIPTWLKHQHPHYKEPESLIPAPGEPQSSPPINDPEPESGPSINTDESRSGLGQAPGEPEARLGQALDSPPDEGGGNPADSGFLIPDSGLLSPRDTRGARSPPRRKPPKVPLPEGFAISDRVRAWAAEHGHSQLEARFDHFVGYARANGAMYTDWDQALMNAIRDNWAKFNGTGAGEGRAETRGGHWSERESYR